MGRIINTIKRLLKFSPLLLSFFIHVGLFCLIWTPSERLVELSALPEEFEIESAAPLKKEEAPRKSLNKIVQSEKSQKQSSDNAQFYGKEDQAVDKQTRARQNDAFAAAGKAAKDLTLKDLGIVDDWKHRSAATDDHLEGIPMGERTVLNTRANRYYSFYERAKEQLRVYWKPEVNQRAATLAVQKKLLDGQQLVTRVVASLDKDGKVQEVRTVQSSGVPQIDAAATTAFYRIGRLPNVPKGMLDNDGVARLYWEFVVNAVGQPKVKIADNDQWKEVIRRID
jgi:TonB family protein